MMLRMVWTGIVVVAVALVGGAVQAALHLEGALYLLFALALIFVVALSNRELFGLAEPHRPDRNE